jgi:hypothetical protein
MLFVSVAMEFVMLWRSMTLKIKKEMSCLHYFCISLLKSIYVHLMVFSAIKWYGCRKGLQQFIFIRLEKILLTCFEHHEEAVFEWAKKDYCNDLDTDSAVG